MMPRASEMRVLVRRGRRISLLRVQGRSKGLLFHEDIQYKVATIRDKARAGTPVWQGR